MATEINYNRYISAYARVRPKAKAALTSIEKSIRDRMLLYFWPNEEPNKLQIYGRVKSPDSFYRLLSWIFPPFSLNAFPIKSAPISLNPEIC